MFMKKRAGALSGFALLAMFATACVITSSDDNDKDKDANVDPGDGDPGNGTGDPDAGDGDPDPDAGNTDPGDGDIEYPADYSEDCGDKGKQATRETARPFGKSVQLCVEDGDEDWLKVTVPNKGGAYLLKVSYDQAAEARFTSYVRAGADNSAIDDMTPEKGTSGFFAVTVGAGTTTNFRFVPYYGSGLVNLKLEVTPENDEHEPNDSKDDAAEVNANEDIKGQLWVPYVSSSDKVADDWFKVDLTEGEAKINLTGVPENLRFTFYVTGPTGANIGSTTTPNTGAQHEWTFNATTAGPHYIRVIDYYSSDLGPFFNNKTPKSLTEQYTFRVEQ